MNKNNEMVRGIRVSLLSLRLGVFIVMFMWAIDKLLNPSHAAAVFSKFYLIDGLGTSLAYAVGGAQVLIFLAFLLGIKKKWTYGFVLVTHGISTFSTYEMLLDPWGPRNLLFYAAIPMLAAAFALYKLRDHDTLCTFKGLN